MCGLVFGWGSLGEALRGNHTVDTNRLIPSIISLRASADIIYWLDIELMALIQDTDLDLIPYFALDCEDRELKIDTLLD